MEMTYDKLNTDDLRGSTVADYLVSLDANFRIADGRKVIYEEPGFLVVELARCLLAWAGGMGGQDFEFESMSFEEVGSVAIRWTPSGWVFSSVFTPDSASVAVERDEVDRCIAAFVVRVEEDLVNLGIDPDDVIRV